MAKAKVMVTQELAKKKMVPVYTKSSHLFAAKHLTSEQAKTFGCEPDYDAYTGGKIRNAPDYDISNWRGCGGHVHLGGDFKCPDFVAALFAELFLGISGAGAWNLPYDMGQRAKWYGKPGIFRPKPYGIEYRTPDNGWLRETWATEQMYSMGLAVSRYLTTTSADKLQTAFRNIPWTMQREYMLKGGDKERMELIGLAREQGVPV